MLELALLASIAVGSADLLGRGVVGWAVGVVGLLIVAGVWGLLVAPKSPRRLSNAPRLVLELVLFAVAGALLLAAGYALAAAALVGAYLVDTLLLRLLKIDETEFVR